MYGGTYYARQYFYVSLTYDNTSTYVHNITYNLYNTLHVRPVK